MSQKLWGITIAFDDKYNHSLFTALILFINWLTSYQIPLISLIFFLKYALNKIVHFYRLSEKTVHFTFLTLQKLQPLPTKIATDSYS